MKRKLYDAYKASKLSYAEWVAFQEKNGDFTLTEAEIAAFEPSVTLPQTNNVNGIDVTDKVATLPVGRGEKLEGTEVQDNLTASLIRCWQRKNTNNAGYHFVALAKIENVKFKDGTVKTLKTVGFISSKSGIAQKMTDGLQLTASIDLNEYTNNQGKDISRMAALYEAP